jgi:uncharacterized membrane protein YdcZ (DUF606 family)
MRTIMLATTIAFLSGFLVLTIYAAVDRGFTILSVVSLLVLLLMAVGIIGAIWQGPDDE